VAVTSAPLPADIERALAACAARRGRLGQPCLYFPVLGSTNDVAAHLAQESGAEGTVVLADEQTAGRGRRGRTWFSPPGSGLYVSVVLQPARASDGARATSLLTLAAGVALAEGVLAATGLPTALKWPNDLYVGRRKLAGILAESVGERPSHVVLGYGINLLRTALPAELADRATTLEVELGRPVDRALVFEETLASLARRYDDLVVGRFDAILDAWRRLAPASVGSRVTWTTPAGPATGVTTGIDQDGALLVRTSGGVQRLVGGEVVWL
jgi:BirA family biotin operon repressor/biotin-[acetyl-CoA-carboxylase] ligase